MAMEAEVMPDRLKFGLAKMPMQEPLDPSIFFNVDHATVLNGLKSFKDWMEYVPEFRKKYERPAQHFSLDF